MAKSNTFFKNNVLKFFAGCMPKSMTLHFLNVKAWIS